METRTVLITVVLKMDKRADPDEVVSELDYSIIHPDIVSTEIIETEYNKE